MKSFAVAIAALASLLSIPINARETLPELQIKRVSPTGTFSPDPSKAYLLVESRNRRPLINFVRAGENDLPDVSGYIQIPRQDRLAGQDDVSVWLYEVPPGDYYVSNITWLYIPMDIDCACMGSVRFSVEAGKVTGVRVETAVLDSKGRQIDAGNRLKKVSKGRSETDHFALRAIAVGHPNSQIWRDVVGNITMAQFTPVADLPNWFDAIPARIMPIEGVLDYSDKGELID